MEDNNLWQRIVSVFKPETTTKEPETVTSIAKVKEPIAGVDFSSRTLFSVSYTGEKNLGELGPVIDYRPDFNILRFRSWQSYYESEITQTVINKYLLWVIGDGLKLKTQPNKVALMTEGIDINSESFNESVEARFSVYSKSKMSDYSNMRTLHKNAHTAYKNAILGGDCLVILRFDKTVKVQVIDGSHVIQPMSFGGDFAINKESGNKVRNGVEINSQGEHVAFYVKKPNTLTEYDRIPAKIPGTNITQAFMVYGLEYRIDNLRGLPFISAVLETIKKLERYKEATVGSAEERQKIAFTIEHDIISDGENPLAKQLSRAFNVDGGNEDLPIDVNGNYLSNLMATTTNKQAINMPRGASVKMHESKNELHFKDFYSVNIDLICAALGIPPSVATSKYDTSFSSNRTGLKDWEHTLNVKRGEFADNFYKKIYDFWLEVEILQNKIQAKHYILARAQGNEFVLEAYRSARFVGASVPHIDPLKEVKAERAKLGTMGDSIPLTTVEDATEALNGGDSDSNMEQFSEEIKEAQRLDIFREKSIGQPIQEIPDND